MAMNNSELAHHYVDYCAGRVGSKPFGKGSNFWYDGHLIHSYSTAIGRFYPVERAFLLSSDKYSSSTTRQMSHLLYVINTSGIAYHAVPYPTEADHQDNLNHFIDRARQSLLSALRAHRHTDDRAYLFYVRQAIRFAKTFNLPLDLETLSPTALIEDEKLLAKYVARRISGEYQPMQAYV